MDLSDSFDTDEIIYVVKFAITYQAVPKLIAICNTGKGKANWFLLNM